MQKVGEGSFSTVFESYKTTGFKRVAIKCIKKSLLKQNPCFAVFFRLFKEFIGSFFKRIINFEKCKTSIYNKTNENF